MKTTLSAYFKFVKTTGKSRHDCIAKSGNYQHFEDILLNKRGNNVGGLSLNLGEVPEQFNNVRHKATTALTRGDNISKLFLFDLQRPTIFYGDAKGTKDALVVVVEGDVVEVFVAVGMKNLQLDVCGAFVNGDLNNEVQALKSQTQRFVLP